MPGQDYSTQLNNFARAIAKRESEGSGGYQAVGVPTKYGRALGAYQIMSDFWPEWAEEAGIPGADWRDPAAQDHVAKYKMSQYYQKYGDWATVAAAWIGGTGGASDFRAGKQGAPDKLGTHVKDYVTDVVGYYQDFGGEAGQNPEAGGIPQGGGSYSGAPPVTDLGVEQQALGDPFGNQQPPERVQSEDAVSSVLGAVSNVIAGGNRQPVAEVARMGLPGGNKDQEDMSGSTVTAAGDEEIQAAPAPTDMSESNFEGFNPTFEQALNQMMADAPGSISITSGFRSIEEQKEKWNEALEKYKDPEIADNWVARPGSSKHNHGLAADLKYASDEVKKWAHNNAAKYGLHFPMSHEPWHVEPIGAR